MQGASGLRSTAPRHSNEQKEDLIERSGVRTADKKTSRVIVHSDLYIKHSR